MYEFIAESAASGNSQATPLWLQVVAIALAPVLGLLGVTIGIRWNSRHQQESDLRENRRSAYVEYATSIGEMVRSISMEGVSAARSGADDEIARYKKVIDAHTQRVTRAHAEVVLIGSPNVVTASYEHFVILGDVSLKIVAALSGKFHTEDWRKITAQGMSAEFKFLRAAQKDMGIPERDRLPGDSRADQEYSKSVMDLMNQTLKSEAQSPEETARR